jgi:nucleotide-binding universal stress UspA family protein
MNKLNTILVGVDFSECSRCALEQASRLARWNDASLSVIHVVDSSTLDNSLTPLPPELDEWRRLNRNHAIGRLADWVKEAGAPAGHRREVMHGVPLDVLLEESRSRHADLLVLGITGDSRLPYGAGTLATKCLRKTATKVLLVKQTHPRPFRRIVACVDFSETSKEVVKHALRVAGQDPAELHFLHVFQTEWNNWSSPDRLSAFADFEKGCSALLEGNLRQFAEVPPENPAFYTVTQAKTHGHGIAEYCRSVDADLVVLGTRGRTTLKYIRLGSTVERLLKEIPCSVLVVRPPAAAAEPPPQATLVNSDQFWQRT